MSKPENLHEWSRRMMGALELVTAMDDAGLFEPHSWRGENQVYSKAEVDYIKAGKSNVDRFITGWRNGRYRNHARDKKGKLVKVEFYIDDNM